jgi:SPP1 family predicted phage head-tail adaptor
VTVTPDGAGGQREGWANLAMAATRCHVKAMSGGERYAAQRAEARANYRITCRYFAGLLESDRLVIAGRAYNIRFINNLELRNRWFVLDVEMGAAT